MYHASGRARLVVAFGVTIALLTLAGIRSGSIAHASPNLQGSTKVAISPATSSVTCGATTEVEVLLSDVEDLFGVDIKVSYDPNKLEVVDSNPTTPGIQVEQGDLPDVSGGQGLIQVNTADNDSGTVSYAAVRLNPAPAQSGSGVIASITFKGKAAGDSPVNLASAILADAQARAISAELVNAKVTVDCDGVPPPPTPTPLSGPPSTPQPPPPGNGPGSGGCTYKVMPGDTLYSIARRHGTSVSAIMAANKIYNPDLIYVGQHLSLPGCAGGPQPPHGPGYPVPPPHDGGCHTHIVKPGETLFGIAYMAGMSVDALAMQNGILNPHLIYVGQHITVCPGKGYGQPGPGYGKPGPGYGDPGPGYGHPGPGYDPMPPSGYYPPGGKCKFTHVVKPGETLFRIAFQYGVSDHSLAVVNNLANPHLIYIGQTLCIP